MAGFYVCIGVWGGVYPETVAGSDPPRTSGTRSEEKVEVEPCYRLEAYAKLRMWPEPELINGLFYSKQTHGLVPRTKKN